VIVVPAIDLRGGRVVRLRQGQLEQETIYGGDPAEAGRRWEAAGAGRLHVVDLDAAISGKPQFDAVAAVIDAVGIPVEVGGGLRVLENAMRYRDRGADRVIFGTAAVADPGVVKEAVRQWPQAVAVALDAKNGMVAVAGWREITTMGALDLAARVKEWGVGRIQYTDVVRDGTLVGPNLGAIEQLARSCGLRITAAGGVSTREDLVRLRTLAPLGVDEVIVGKALYEGRFTVAEANAALAGQDDAPDR
jgi:phosphoribosylformimino-5-aminoimidazole carboxamide ribotide isomerase